MCGGGGPSGSIENENDETLALYHPPSDGDRFYDQEGYDRDLEAYDRAQAEIQRRQQVRAQLAAQAAERENILKAQREQAVEMERQQAAIVAQQEAQATQLQAQQAERLAGIRTAGSAVTQSLQILGKQQAKQGPTAAATAPADKKAVSRMAPNSGLRIGSTQAGSGAGANVAI